MMRQYELVERVKSYNPEADEALLDRAYIYAMMAHGTQKRASGDPYFSHPLEVAAILTELKLDDATIVAALLHDTIEDTPATKAELAELFGIQIAELVDGLTKLKKLDLVSKKAVQAENLRKLLLAIVSDVRVVLVKLADRLHNMRTLHFVPPEKRTRIAQETIDIYAPLAGRMGMQDMREELEDLSFAVLNPDAYATISARLKAQHEQNSRVIETIEMQLSKKLAEQGILAEVSGRQKKPYSIFRKMERKAVSFEQLSDIVGFRVTVGSVGQCYQAIGTIHTTWAAVPGRFKDYISTPKQNDYQSIHTTVIGPAKQRIEVQIRTAVMHEVAEFGVAAHALYKDGVDLDTFQKESRAYAWLRHTIDMLSSGDPEEFLEHTKLELFTDQVLCFTPKGRMIALPSRAKPIDFAYAVHTDIGNTCVGARINGIDRPLTTELQNGDEVEIRTDPNAKPAAAWEGIVATGRARAAIRRAARASDRAQFIDLGRTLVKSTFERASLTFSDEQVKEVLGRLARGSIEDVYWNVGRDEMRPTDVLKAVYPDYNPTLLAGADPRERLSGDKDALPIRGIGRNQAVRFAPNSGAIPGDRIVGIMTPNEGVVIYPIHSPALSAFDREPERWLDVRWDMDQLAGSLYPARIAIKSRNVPGGLAAITQVIADQKANIDNLKMNRAAQDFTDIVLDIEVHDTKHLKAIIAGVRDLGNVAEVSRVNV